MTEQVIRHRGPGRDENGKLTADASSVPLMAFCVAPGTGGTSAGTSGGSDRRERGRTGSDSAYVVYFLGTADIDSDDELTVRGKRYQVTVNDWHLGGRGGLEVLCTRGQG